MFGVQEYSVPAAAKVADDDRLTDAVWANADEHPDEVAYRRAVGDEWTPVTFAEFRDEVVAVAKGFVAAGLQPGDRVGIVARTRYEWTLLDYALWAAGCAGLPIYETSSASQYEWCLSDSGARGVIVETDEHRATLEQVTGSLPDLVHVWQIDAGHGGGPAVDALKRGRPGRLRRRPGGPPHRRPRRRPRDADLHLGHHRPPEGLRDHAPQPAVRGPRGR